VAGVSATAEGATTPESLRSQDRAGNDTLESGSSRAVPPKVQAGRSFSEGG
jgi:hypothetical protein